MKTTTKTSFFLKTQNYLLEKFMENFDTALMTLPNDVPNSHVPGFNFFGSLVNALFQQHVIVTLHARCHTESPENSF